MVPSWECGGGEQDMGSLPPSLPALWAAVGEKGCGTIFSWSVPWQEGRAEKHGQGEGLAKVRVRRQAEASGRAGGAAHRARRRIRQGWDLVERY